MSSRKLVITPDDRNDDGPTLTIYPDDREGLRRKRRKAPSSRSRRRRGDGEDSRPAARDRASSSRSRGSESRRSRRRSESTTSSEQHYPLSSSKPLPSRPSTRRSFREGFRNKTPSRPSPSPAPRSSRSPSNSSNARRHRPHRTSVSSSASRSSLRDRRQKDRHSPSRRLRERVQPEPKPPSDDSPSSQRPSSNSQPPPTASSPSSSSTRDDSHSRTSVVPPSTVAPSSTQSTHYPSLPSPSPPSRPPRRRRAHDCLPAPPPQGALDAVAQHFGQFQRSRRERTVWRGVGDGGKKKLYTATRGPNSNSTTNANGLFISPDILLVLGLNRNNFGHFEVSSAGFYGGRFNPDSLRVRDVQLHFTMLPPKPIAMTGRVNFFLPSDSGSRRSDSTTTSKFVVPTDDEFLGFLRYQSERQRQREQQQQQQQRHHSSVRIEEIAPTNSSSHRSRESYAAAATPISFPKHQHRGHSTRRVGFEEEEEEGDVEEEEEGEEEDRLVDYDDTVERSLPVFGRVDPPLDLFELETEFSKCLHRLPFRVVVEVLSYLDESFFPIIYIGDPQCSGPTSSRQQSNEHFGRFRFDRSSRKAFCLYPRFVFHVECDQTGFIDLNLLDTFPWDLPLKQARSISFMLGCNWLFEATSQRFRFRWEDRVVRRTKFGKRVRLVSNRPPSVLPFCEMVSFVSCRDLGTIHEDVERILLPLHALPRLKTLNFRFCETAENPDDVWRSLPKKIRSLTYLTRTRRLVNAFSFTQFLPCLRRLTLLLQGFDHSTETLMQLPVSLRELSIECRFWLRTRSAAAFRRLSLLRVLRFAEMGFCADSLSLLPSSLRKLSFVNCVSLRSQKIAALPHLRSFEASGCSDLSSLTFLPSTAACITLVNCSGLNDRSLESLPRDLTFLDLRTNRQICGTFLSVLSPVASVLCLKSTGFLGECATYFPPHLRVLDVSDCPSIVHSPTTFADFVQGLLRLQFLEELTLGEVDDVCLACFASVRSSSTFLSLKSLTIHGNLCSDRGFRHLPFERLETFILPYHSNLTDDDVRAIPNCGSLHRLHLEGVSNLTNGVVDVLNRAFRKLRVLEMYDASQVSEAVLVAYSRERGVSVKWA